MLGKKHSFESKLKMSNARKGRKHTEDHKKNLSLALIERWKNPVEREKFRKILRPPTWLGKKHSEKTKRKIADAHRGHKSHFWKGGKSAVNVLLRHSIDYRLWRTSVFNRDKYTCKICGQKGGKLTADHIKPWSTHEDLRFDISNGRTLCVNCHRKTDTWGRKLLSKLYA